MPITSKQKKDMEEDSTTAYYYTDNGDYEDELCNKSGVNKFESIATPIFFSVVIALSLVGNILVLAILALYENLRSLTNAFILNLALSDLVFTFGLPFWAYYHMWDWTLGRNACKAVNFIFFVGFYSSIVFLTMMTIHRYLVVVYPLSDFGSKKRCYGITTSIVIWTVSLFAAVPALLFSEVQNDDHDSNVLRCEYSSKTWKIAGMYQQNMFFVLAFSVIAFCYIRILVTILRSRSHSRFRTVKLIFVIVVVFFVGWAPYNAMIFLQSLTDLGMEPFTDCSVSVRVDYSFNVCRLIAFSHCCLNPVFYVFVGMKFRSHMKMILHRVLQRQSSIELQLRSSRFNIHSHGSMY